MTETPPERTTDEPKRRADALDFDWDRRRLLRAVGAGAGASLATGVATARGGARADGDADEARARSGEGDGAEACEQDSCFHPFSGFTLFPDDVDDTDPPAEPDHTVTLHVEVPPEERCGFFMFDPVGLHVEPGDVVAFDPETNLGEGRIAGDHTVTAYHPVVSRQRRIPEDASPFSSTIVGAHVSWLYRFETPGVYDIYCGPHEGLGMVMRVVVGGKAAEDFGAPAEPGAIPPLGAAGAVLDHDRLKPANIKRNSPVSWSDDLCPGSSGP